MLLGTFRYLHNTKTRQLTVYSNWHDQTIKHMIYIYIIYIFICKINKDSTLPRSVSCLGTYDHFSNITLNYNFVEVKDYKPLVYHWCYWKIRGFITVIPHRTGRLPQVQYSCVVFLTYTFFYLQTDIPIDNLYKQPLSILHFTLW